MNVSDIRRAVDVRTGIYLTAEASISMIDQALQEYALHARWPWLTATQTINTTADDATYTLDDPVQSIESVEVNGYPALAFQQADLDAEDVQSVRGSYGYSVTGSTITIYPTPSGVQTVTVRYVRSEPSVADDDDEPLLPDRFKPMIAALAAAYVCERENDPRSSFYRNQARDLLRAMEKAALHKVRRGQQIRVRQGAPY